MAPSAEPMAITEQTTPEFRNDLNRLSSEDRARVAVALRRSYDLLRNNRGSFFAREAPTGDSAKGWLLLIPVFLAGRTRHTAHRGS